MEKPQLQTIQGYDLMAISDYVSEKYNLNLDFNEVWHWFVSNYEPNNGSYTTLITEVYPKDKDFIKNMKEALAKEFGKEVPLLIEW